MNETALDMFGHALEKITQPKQKPLAKKTLQDTDVYRNLEGKRVELIERIQILTKNKFEGYAAERNAHWISIWRHELAATLRALHALGEQQ